MADNLTAAQRSVCMRAVRGRNTAPELLVRRVAHNLGFRYGLNKTSLPGTPDLVFSARHKIIFVHGCFWHLHDCKAGRKVPSKNWLYWQRKRKRNVDRDRRNIAALRRE